MASTSTAHTRDVINSLGGIDITLYYCFFRTRRRRRKKQRHKHARQASLGEQSVGLSLEVDGLLIELLAVSIGDGSKNNKNAPLSLRARTKTHSEILMVCSKMPWR